MKINANILYLQMNNISDQDKDFYRIMHNIQII